MALAAILDTGVFIVGVVEKHGRRPLGVGKFRVVHILHILLRVGRGRSQDKPQQDRDE